ncbi:MAG TPA: SDR family oxidoreductase [Anaerolineales bacterium]|nr:SDR family oxidoreductase [Anaerolineales bacterium]
MPKVVLITGCSTGIGRDLAERLSQHGYLVVATARKAETLNDLPVAMKLPLDVTQTDSVNEALASTLQQFGRIDILVNNAGYSVPGALEEVSEGQTQQVFDVNVFGALRMIRAVAPHMRKQRSGCILNLSSIAGKLSTPGNGTYSATKFALEALSDALRLELAPFGIQVIVIEPGAIKTQFDETAQAQAEHILSDSASPYRPLYEKSRQFAAGMRQHEPGPEDVSKIIQQAIEASHPRARYLAAIPFSGKLVLSLRDFLWDLVLRQIFRIHTPLPDGALSAHV